MSYRFSGPLGNFFRSCDNAWSTMEEIANGSGLDRATVGKRIINLRHFGRLEEQDGPPRRFRMSPEILFEKRGEVKRRGQDMSPRIERIARDFCKRHGVSKPVDATRRNPVAMAEWCDLLREA